MIKGRLLPLSEAATRLNLLPAACRHHVRVGHLPATVVGGRYFVAEKDLRKFRRGKPGRKPKEQRT